MYITIMRILRLKRNDVIIPPLAVIAVTVATQGETLLLTLFSFEGDEGMDCLFVCFFFE